MDIMIDIETKATSYDAKLLSIGACAFQANRPPDMQKLLKHTFYVNVGDYLEDLPFTEHELTKQWWEKQGDEAKQVLEGDRKPPEVAIGSLLSWVRGIHSSYGDGTVWANPPQFDLGILGYHFDVFGYNCPWNWHSVRDFRTLREIAKMKNGFVPSEPKSVAGPNGTVVFHKHNALHDAIVQAFKTQELIQHLRKA